MPLNLAVAQGALPNKKAPGPWPTLICVCVCACAERLKWGMRLGFFLLLLAIMPLLISGDPMGFTGQETSKGGFAIAHLW